MGGVAEWKMIWQITGGGRFIEWKMIWQITGGGRFIEWKMMWQITTHVLYLYNVINIYFNLEGGKMGRSCRCKFTLLVLHKLVLYLS